MHNFEYKAVIPESSETEPEASYKNMIDAKSVGAFRIYLHNKFNMHNCNGLDLMRVWPPWSCVLPCK
jgi:hypothetical protein